MNHASYRAGSRSRWIAAAALALVIGVAAVLGYFSSALRAKEPKAAPQPPAVPVSVARALRQTVPFRLPAIGNVEPYTTVAVKSRVDGQIVEVDFREGQEVRRGSVLFRIDPRPYQAALAQAEAQLARDLAQRDQARAQEQRYKDLVAKNFVSKDAYSQFRTNAETAAAAVEASRAAVEQARLNLEYCIIRSPIDGYAGKIQIQIGNLVKANDTTPLVVINQVEPIYVSFSVPEQQLPLVRRYLAAGPLEVEARPSGESRTVIGKLVFVDNAVDTATATIRLKAQFANHDHALWPGQFVNVSLRLFDQKDAIVIPAPSVQTGPEGQYVFVIRPDMTAEMRSVVVDRTDGDNAIIARGLTGGEQVVTKGQLRLVPGARVRVVS